jgi:hypothetical protein
VHYKAANSSILLAQVVREECKRAKHTLAGGKCLHTIAKEGDHRKAAMLDLGFFQAVAAFAFCKIQWIKEASRVAPAHRVQLCVAVDLSTADEENLDPDKLSDGEGEAVAKVLRAVQLNLASFNPRDTSLELGNDAAKAGKHCPPAVNELTLAETLNAKYLQGSGSV